MIAHLDRTANIQQAAHDELERIRGALELAGLNRVLMIVNLRKDGRIDHVVCQPEYRSAFNHDDGLR